MSQLNATNITCSAQAGAWAKKAKEHGWAAHLKELNNQEALEHQIPFLQAVKEFKNTLMLAADKTSLVLKSVDVEQLSTNLGQRLKNGQNNLLANINEEFGLKNQSHEQTFTAFLKCLGASSSDLKKANQWHPAVHAWQMQVNKTIQMHPAWLGVLMLAVIEDTYAGVSSQWCQWLKTMGLESEQNHYKVHDKLDIEHANELYDFALALKEIEDANQEISTEPVSFEQQVYEHFMGMLMHLMPLSKVALNRVGALGVSFAISREDPLVELTALGLVQRGFKSKAPMRCAFINSGGEHVFNALNWGRTQSCPMHIKAWDINSKQIEHSEKKIQSKKRLQSIQNPMESKFEWMFKHIADALSLHQCDHYTLIDQSKASANVASGLGSDTNKNKDPWINGYLWQSIYKKQPWAMDYLKTLTDKVFDAKVLEVIFGPKASQYSSGSFAEHFFNVFVKLIDQACLERLWPVALGDIFNQCKDLSFDQQFVSCVIEQGKVQDWAYTTKRGSLIDNLKSVKAPLDLVSISNVPDWQSEEENKQLCHWLGVKMQTKGIVVCRQLLGSFKLKEALVREGFDILDISDETHFYRECFLAIKKAHKPIEGPVSEGDMYE